MNKKNEIISIPIKPGDVQNTHDLITEYTKNKNIKNLEFLAEYLDLKREKALSMDYEDNQRDANLLDDLGRLALDSLSDLQQDIKDKKY